MGDVEEVPRKGIRQAVEFPHSPDEATNLHDGNRSGAADNRCRRGRDGNGARAITIGEGTGIRASDDLAEAGALPRTPLGPISAEGDQVRYKPAGGDESGNPHEDEDSSRVGIHHVERKLVKIHRRDEAE